MAVAIVHYHLRRGGVTRVIEAQSEALRRSGIEHVILSGTRYRGDADLPVVVLPELRYREQFDPGVAERLHGQIVSAAQSALGALPEIWHVHNPTLGKNVHLPFLIHGLAQNRQRLVLHFHDFAEDGRPGNYVRLADQVELYPLAPQIQYAFINSRDRALLVAAGVPERQTALLPNAVVPPRLPESALPPAGSPLVLYPVRGIRRKNLGEVCLLAALAPPGVRFAVTLAPENPQWQPIHDQWVAFATRHRLPVHFGVVGDHPPEPGLPADYETWLSRATHLLTTSIAEGFGLAFLEPIALRKPLLGRDLPDITTDFKRHGLELGNLYHQLLIPTEWIDHERLLARLTDAMDRVYTSYRVPLDPAFVQRASDALHHHEALDFGNLPEDLQQETIARALHEPNCVQVRVANNSEPAALCLSHALEELSPGTAPSALQHYSIENYAASLEALYLDLQRATPDPPAWLEKSRILHQFLRPERFHFLRT